MIPTYETFSKANERQHCITCISHCSDKERHKMSAVPLRTVGSTHSLAWLCIRHIVSGYINAVLIWRRVGRGLWILQNKRKEATVPKLRRCTYRNICPKKTTKYCSQDSWTPRPGLSLITHTWNSTVITTPQYDTLWLHATYEDAECTGSYYTEVGSYSWLWMFCIWCSAVILKDIWTWSTL